MYAKVDLFVGIDLKSANWKYPCRPGYQNHIYLAYFNDFVDNKNMLMCLLK